MNTKNNQKSKLTRHKLHLALLQLLQNRHISDITVKEICEKAQVNRSTFYSHYQNPMDLLQEIEDTTVEHLNTMVDELRSQYKEKLAYNFFLKALESIKQNADSYRILLSTNCSNNLERVLVRVTDIDKIRRRYHLEHFSTQELVYHQAYCIAGVLAVVREWVNRSCQESPEKIARMLDEMC